MRLMTEGEKLIPILDGPSGSPGMRFEEQAEVLANFLANTGKGTLTIGIFGGYGSGKTTLMNAIRRKLEELKSTALLTVEFNAWRYDHEEHLFLPFLAAIKQHEEIAKIGVGTRIKAACRGFIRGLSLEATVGFAKIGLETDKSAEAEEKFLKDAIDKVLDDYTDIYEELRQVTLGKDGKVVRRIVVFIDDLDRCVPEKAFALLESLKSFMDIEGFSFVLGLDPRAVETYLDKKYGEGFCVTPEEYLEKMVQIPVHLARPKQDDVFKVIENLSMETKAVLEQGQDLKYFLPSNLRQVKRILNMHRAIMAVDEVPSAKELIGERVDLRSDVLLGLLIIELRWPRAYWALHSFREYFRDILKQCKANNKAKIPVKLLKQSKAIEEVKDVEFGKIYDLIARKLNYKMKDLKPYIDRLGWPVNIESKLVREE